MTLSWNSNLIPFGVQKATGLIVDVSEVAKGRACGCLLSLTAY